jgi:hypothetical protein
MNWDLLNKFQDHYKRRYNLSILRQWYLVFNNSLKYNISILEFYQFGFNDKTHQEKLKWAGTGTMYEFQLQANPKSERVALDDKRIFAKKYKKFLAHKIYALDELTEEIIKDLLSMQKVVFKDATGKCGSGVLIKETKNLNLKGFKEYMRKHQFDMVETYIEQHPEINKLSPSGVNTIRIFTKFDKQNNFIILGCRMRISVNSTVDNMAAGNLAAPVDELTGIISGPGVYSDITKRPEKIHPVTKTKIVGFQIPYWNDILNMVEEASHLYPNNKSIGWDVIVTKDGPGLLEGNHDWCKLVWQLPVKKGLKELLYN